METLDRIGSTLPEAFKERDAVHIAVLPVIVGEDRMKRGSYVRLETSRDGIVARLVADEMAGRAVGVLDPFLPNDPKKNDTVYAFMKPGTIEGLRHQWKAAAIDQLEQSAKSESAAWLVQFAEHWGFDYTDLINTAKIGNDYITAYGWDVHGEGDLDDTEYNYTNFWYHMERMTEMQFPQHHRDSISWSCSC